MDDLVVIVPGILGSTLHKNGVPAWERSAGAVVNAVRTFGRSIRDLQLPEGIGDAAPDDGVEPVEIMPDFHVLPGVWTPARGYSRVIEWAAATLHAIPSTDDRAGSLMLFPYDWRLSNRYNGERLAREVERSLSRWRDSHRSRRDAQVVFLCHSMGGLVARWAIQQCGLAEVTKRLVTIGTPHRGSVNALTQLVNGIRKGPAPFALDLTQFARSLPSLHQLLPQYACMDAGAGLRRVDETPLPDLSSAMIADAVQFHRSLDADAQWWSRGFRFLPVHGQKQDTATTASLMNGAIVAHSTIKERNEWGDGTVPTLAATPIGYPVDGDAVFHVTDQHGSLTGNSGLLDHLEGVLTANPVQHMGPPRVAISVSAEPVIEAGSDIRVTVAVPDGETVPLEAVLNRPGGARVRTERLLATNGTMSAAFRSPDAGGYEIVVRGATPSARSVVSEVTASTFVWDEQ
ncbi:lipase/acyltransferase domain-containing protein [Microbacterium sp. SSM24]|uniref:lipase/acyltransferase domain-containing protein n=1 Tax=Microbacterium sp. SSM24 TaxID=2991714 RepID=UPI002226C94D|nr:hypothetical protein [Microbacterium sp. SSM24]MCW3493872.1 hypothetical protein [Microbacterium sp. SSM24]